MVQFGRRLVTHAVRTSRRVEVRIAAPAYAELRRHLLSDPAVEQMAMLLCGRQRTPDGRVILLVREVLRVPPEALDVQTVGHVTVSQDFSRRVLMQARDEGLDLIDVHSHQFSDGAAAFSATDDANERLMAGYVARRLGGLWYGAMVFTQADVAARLWLDGAPVPVERIVVIGSPLRAIRPRTVTASGASTDEGDTADWRPFARQVLALGPEGQARLAALHVAVVGVGGLGSVVAVHLAHLGVGRLVLIDADTVDHSNLNRLIGASAADADERRPKVEVLAGYAKRVHPAIHVEAVQAGLQCPDAWRAAAGCDAVLVCVDNDGARLVANRLAVQYLLPMVDVATGIRTDDTGRIAEAGGQVRTVLPGGFCLCCIDGLDLTAAGRARAPEVVQAIYRERGYVLTEDVPAPSVITLNTAVATEAVNELLAFAAGVRPPRPYLLYDFLAAHWTALGGSRRDDCPVCGVGAYAGLGDHEPPPAVTSLEALPHPYPSPLAWRGGPNPVDNARSPLSGGAGVG